jgi:hypothetical protein
MKILICAPLFLTVGACSKPNNAAPQPETNSNINSIRLETKSIEQAANEAAALVEAEAEEEVKASKAKNRKQISDADL